jgi:hypothetical protein
MCLKERLYISIGITWRCETFFIPVERAILERSILILDVHELRT